MALNFDIGVYRKDPEHIYYNAQGSSLRSVSKALELVSTPFDGKMISERSAVAVLKSRGESLSRQAIEAESSKIRGGWGDYGTERANRGTYWHNNMESFTKSGKCDEYTKPVVEAIYMTYLKQFYRNYSEVMVSDLTSICGTADILGSHSKKKEKLLHIRDFKTNKRKPVNEMSYDKWMQGPVKHMIQNDYTKYALQQSIYGYLLMCMGYEVASISLIWMDITREETEGVEGVRHELIPVPFMLYEAKEIVNYCKMVA